MLNPLFFALLDRYEAKKKAAEDAAAAAQSAKDTAAEAVAEAAKKKPARVELPVTALTGHVVLVGYGRVGSVVGKSLRQGGVPFLVIEDDPGCLERLTEAGIEKITGNAAAPGMLVAANLEAARGLIVAIPDAFEGGQIVAKARAISATLPIIARAHSEEEIAHLKHHGANSVIMGEQEIAKAMIAQIGFASA